MFGLSKATSILHTSVRSNLVDRDAKLPDNEDIPQRIEELKQDAYGRFVSDSENRVKMHGGDLPLRRRDGQCLYHVRPNVTNISVCLDLIKRKHTILVLPLLAEYLRVHEEADFRQRKAMWTWAYGALCNVSIMGRIFHCTRAHQTQIQHWSQWDEAKQRAVLEALRTRIFSQTVRDELRSWSEEELFGDDKFRQFKDALPESSAVVWEDVYGWMPKIILKYGVTRQEFDEYCTIPSKSANDVQVFYPFHILSRPQAEGVWEWHTLYATAKAMLNRMRTWCNKYAETAGFGERQMARSN